MASPRKKAIDDWTADKWFRAFFSNCCLPDEDSENYAVIFAQNGMRSDMLPLLNKDLLKEMKIVKVGHIIEILRAAQELSSQEQRSEISHLSKQPTVQSKVVSLKSVVTTKESRAAREREIGGGKRDVPSMKRSVPVEAPTLSVKMPSRLVLPAPSAPLETPKIARLESKDQRTSAQSAEATNSTEKKKLSVFERLGNKSDASSTTPNGESSAVQSSPPSGGILKKSAVAQPGASSLHNNQVMYGPLELNKSTARQAKMSQGSGRLILNNSNAIRSKSPVESQPPQTVIKLNQRSLSPVQTSRSKSPVRVEPSFHVTMSMKLSNPLVSKVPNGPLSRKQQERRNFLTSLPNSRPSAINPRAAVQNARAAGVNVRPSSSTSAEDEYYGTMAADQIQMSKDSMVRQRLGNRGMNPSTNKVDSLSEKKRVSFGIVRTKEIPALPGTQPLSTNAGIFTRQRYTGSVALRTARLLKN